MGKWGTEELGNWGTGELGKWVDLELGEFGWQPPVGVITTDHREGKSFGALNWALRLVRRPPGLKGACGAGTTDHNRRAAG